MTVELRRSRKSLNHSPHATLETLTISLDKGKQEVKLAFDRRLDEPG